MKLTFRLLCLSILLSGLAYADDIVLAGSTSGLYRLDRGAPDRLWDKGEVRKILRAGNVWYFLTSNGVMASADLASFEERNVGLPVKVVKQPENGQKTFIREVQELKDLEVHPTNPQILVTATKDAVYLTRDGGLSWKSVGISAATAGVKAVAVLDLPDQSGKSQLTIFMSHPIYGVSWRQPDVPKTTWADLDNGLEQVPTIKWPDEIADLAAVSRGGEIELYASQTFMPRLYRLDWAARRFTKLWAGPEAIDTTEGLAITATTALFTGVDRIGEIPLVAWTPTLTALTPGTASSSQQAIPAPAPSAPRTEPAIAVTDWNDQLDRTPGNLLAAWIPAARSGGRGALSLTELWLLHPERQTGRYTEQAKLKKGNYLPVHQVTTQAGLESHLRTLKNNDLNMLVVDMKDDTGALRYNSKDPLVLAKGRPGRGIDVESFVKTAKANGMYLVARIVVFKDKSLSSYGGAKYAVWDRAEKKAWQGYELVTQKVEVSAGEQTPPPETVRKYYQEYWVDPYSEEVWEYNVSIAKELVARGFDEIQFDYIRFPTDGTNLDNASYRWQDAGMDKESALMSFLSYARKEIAAPISIDIYGANGWYRTGARTGQDVELLSRYVDVICPMFYPSHFEQTFLAQPPAEERPYRIYYYGSFRNAVIARNHVIVRPWAQAFYLNVFYDRAYYNADYVQRQIFGARDSINEGYTYWNNSGRYGDLRPDLSMDEKYPWKSPEAANPDRPAFSALAGKN